jgi:hypothetical protein
MVAASDAVLVRHFLKACSPTGARSIDARRTAIPHEGLASREPLVPELVVALSTVNRDSNDEEDGYHVRDDHSKKRCVIKVQDCSLAR